MINIYVVVGECLGAPVCKQRVKAIHYVSRKEVRFIVGEHSICSHKAIQTGGYGIRPYSFDVRSAYKISPF